MSDQFTEVTTRSWGSRLGGSFGAILGSLLLFFASFVLLFWNEGQVDISNVAATAQEAPYGQLNESLEGLLVSVTGQVTTPEVISDNQFLSPGNYLGLMRSVEMYAWNQNSSSTSEVKVGGSEETKTTYSYNKKWTSSPASSSTFKVQEGHYNPPLAYESASVIAKEATVGAYTIYPERMQLPEFAALQVTSEMVPSIATTGTADSTMTGAVMTESGTLMGTGAVLTETTAQVDPSKPRVINNALYLGVGSPTAPQIGDVQITYKVLQPGLRGTVFGRQSGSAIDSYKENDVSLYALYAGNRDEAITSMHNAHVMMSWALRVIGFLMMWGGLSGVFAPLHVLLDVLPFLGQVSRGAMSVVTFVVAFVLSVLTIIISMILHNIWIILFLAIAGIAAAFFWMKKKGQKAAS